MQVQVVQIADTQVLVRSSYIYSGSQNGIRGSKAEPAAREHRRRNASPSAPRGFNSAHLKLIPQQKVSTKDKINIKKKTSWKKIFVIRSKNQSAKDHQGDRLSSLTCFVDKTLAGASLKEPQQDIYHSNWVTYLPRRWWREKTLAF